MKIQTIIDRKIFNRQQRLSEPNETEIKNDEGETNTPENSVTHRNTAGRV